MIEPAARTCTSKLSPTTALASASSRTAISSRGASSSSLTISCPRRAVEGQCTRRSDSPCSYSRTLCSSKPVWRRKQQPAAVVRPCAGLGEEAVQPHEPRIDEQRSRRGQRDDRALERERIGQLGAHVLECVAAARNLLEDVANAQPPAVSAQDVSLLAESADALDERYRRRQHVPRRLELGDDGTSSPSTCSRRPSRARRGMDGRRSAPRPRPTTTTERGARRHRVERLGAEAQAAR